MSRQTKKIHPVAAGATIVILIVLMILSSGNQSIISSAKSVVGGVLSPFEQTVTTVKSKSVELFERVFGSAMMREQNKTLVEENKKLTEEINRYELVVANKVFLENEYEMLKSTSYSLISADIKSKDPSNFFIRYTINKGEKDGVSVDDIVVVGARYDETTVLEGVIGKVYEVGSSWSKVTSILDERNNISIKLTRNLENGVLNGMGEKGLSGYMLNATADVKVGDRLVTSGLGGVYPKDLYIGSVVDIQEESGLKKNISVEPAVDFTRIQRVYVIRQGAENE